MSLLPASSYTPQATFTRSGKVKQTEFNIRDYGARGAQQVTDGVLTGTAVTSASAPFVPSDVGKIIFASNTSNDIILQTKTITAYVSPTEVTISGTGTNGSSRIVYWGYDDTNAILDAVNDAGPVGGIVKYPPGNYIVSDTIVWDVRSSTNSALGPSMIGAEGRSGPSPDFDQLGTVNIVCDPTNFPQGEYIFDFLGPTAQDKAICGVMVRGFVFTCNNRGAGVRFFNCFSVNASDFIVGVDPATPNPAIAGAFAAGTSNTGAVADTANPTQNSFYNTFERIFVQGAAKDGFQMAGGAGSYSLMSNCMANNCGRYGYNISEKCSLVACHAQSNALTNGLFGADYNIGRYDIVLVGCIVYSGKPDYGNGVKLAGGASAIAHFVGCTFYGAEKAGLTEDIAAIVNIEGNLQNVQFTNCTFSTGTSSNTSDFVYVSQYATGRVIFDGCSFLTEYGSALTNVPVNYNGKYDVVSFKNCHGINPDVTQEWGNLTNARQTLEIGVTGGVPTGGTFTLTFGGQTTTALAYNASAATIQAALEALSSIGAGNVACSGGAINTHPVVVNFQGTLANAAQAAITANSASLTPSGTVTIETILPGGPNVTFDRVDGQLHTGTLTGDISPTITDGIARGDILSLKFTQDGTGSRVITWPANVINGPVLSTTAAAVDMVSLTWDGTNWRKVSQGLSRAESVSEGGTGKSSLTAYAVLAGGATATGALQQVSGLGGAGQILTSNGAGALPTWENAASGFANPMTTLGDIMVEDSSPAPARLAGNTTTTKKYLSQTGNGTISALPSWAQIAAADLSNGTSGSGSIALTTGPTLSGATLADGTDIAVGTGTGTKIGTSTSQKIGFYNATPIAQASNTTDLRTLLVNLGLIASGGATPLNLNGGAFTTTGNTSIRQLSISDSFNVVLGTSTGNKIGTATSQKIGFWNATPIVQPTTGVAAATFVANTSGIADDSATFDGYTIGQVVKALRNAGLLA